MSDLLTAELQELGTTGIVEDDSGARAFFDTGAQARSAAAAHDGEYEFVADRDWVALSREGWQHRAIGTRLWLAPDWDSTPTPQGRIRIHYRDGMSCGSGEHPCTRLCLAAMDELMPAGAVFLDVGAGSGLLLEAASKLGASVAAGCEIDPAMLTPGSFLGSLRSVRTASIDFVVANINEYEVERLMPDIQRVLKPGGTALTSGFRGEGYRTLEGWALNVIRT